MRIILLSVGLLFSVNAFGFNNYYDCIQVGSSTLGWRSIDNKYEAASSTTSKKPITVKLTDLDSSNPYLSGQSTTPLTKVSTDGETLWLIEVTPGKTVVTWTLFKKNTEYNIPKTLLISSKSYELGGPVNFTTIYECVP